MIKGPQDRINWLMVAAFRYCVGRHTTQAMYGVGDVILDNLDVLHTEFIKQFIREIEREQYVTELDQERNKRYAIDFFARLQGHIKDYQRDLKDEKGEKQQELYNEVNTPAYFASANMILIVFETVSFILTVIGLVFQLVFSSELGSP